MAGSLTNAVFTVSVQLIALAFLAPAEFGLFSFVYLFFGLGLSMSHSLVIDVWVRSKPGTIAWRTYASVLMWLGLALSLIAFVGAFAVSRSVVDAVAVAVGIGAGVYRNGSRFYSAREFSWRHVIVPDAVGCVVLLGAFFSLAAVTGSFQSVLVAWALAQCTAALLSRRATPLAPRALAHWLTHNWRVIRQLWLDSSLLDASVIITPLIVSGFMSLSNFGVYRAISSAALPVRLLLSPLRPNISNLPLRSFQSTRTTLAILGAGVSLGAVVAFLLIGVHASGILPGSILPHLADYAVAASVFTVGNLVSSVYYVAARSHLSFDKVRSGRYFETAVMIVGPLAGLAVAGVAGAVWGFAISSVFVAVNWLRIARRPR